VTHTSHAGTSAGALGIAQALHFGAVLSLPLALAKAVSVHILHAALAMTIAVVRAMRRLAKSPLEAQVAGAGPLG